MKVVPIEDGCKIAPRHSWNYKFSCHRADGQLTRHELGANPLKMDLIVKCFENGVRDMRTAIHIIYAKGQNRYRYMFRAC